MAKKKGGGAAYLANAKANQANAEASKAQGEAAKAQAEAVKVQAEATADAKREATKAQAERDRISNEKEAFKAGPVGQSIFYGKTAGGIGAGYYFGSKWAKHMAELFRKSQRADVKEFSKLAAQAQRILNKETTRTSKAGVQVSTPSKIIGTRAESKAVAIINKADHLGQRNPSFPRVLSKTNTPYPGKLKGKGEGALFGHLKGAAGYYIGLGLLIEGIAARGYASVAEKQGDESLSTQAIEVEGNFASTAGVRYLATFAEERLKPGAVVPAEQVVSVETLNNTLRAELAKSKSKSTSALKDLFGIGNSSKRAARRTAGKFQKSQVQSKVEVPKAPSSAMPAGAPEVVADAVKFPETIAEVKAPTVETAMTATKDAADRTGKTLSELVADKAAAKAARPGASRLGTKLSDLIAKDSGEVAPHLKSLLEPGAAKTASTFSELAARLGKHSKPLALLLAAVGVGAVATGKADASTLAKDIVNALDPTNVSGDGGLADAAFKALSTKSAVERQAEDQARAMLTTPSAIVGAMHNTVPVGQTALMDRVAKSGLDAYYRGPVPAEFEQRLPYMAMAAQGAIEANGRAVMTDPLRDVPKPPPQPNGPHHTWDDKARAAALETRKRKAQGF